MPPELIASLHALHVIRLRFHTAVVGRLELPPLPGATLHGMLGAALAREACTCGVVPENGGGRSLPPFSKHGADCLFRQFYRPVVPAELAQALDFGSDKATDAPAPHLLRPPLGRRVFAPGDRLSFEIVLVGRAATGASIRVGDTHAVAHWKRIVRAVKRGLGEREQPDRRGLGRSRVPCPLVEVSDGAGHPVWVRGYGFVEEPVVEIPAQREMPQPAGWLHLRFLSPVAIKDDSSIIDKGRRRTLSGPDPLGALCRALLRRVHRLSALYCQGEGHPLIRTGPVIALPKWEPEQLSSAKVSKPRLQREAIEARRPVLFKRVENHDIHAEIGELHALGVPDDFIKLCRIAEAIGVGSKTTHGLGWFEVLA